MSKMPPAPRSRVKRRGFLRGAKDAICRQLAIIGSSRSEPVLEAVLQNKTTEAMVRYALHGLQAK